jgi:uncharacterized protein
MTVRTVSPLDHHLLARGLFYPWPNRFPEPFYVEGQGYRLGCRYRRVSKDGPTIIHFHGNGETVADYVGEFEDRIAAMGANLLLAEYRGYGMSSGTPLLVSMLDDVGLIMQSAGVEPEKTVFFGRSLGSLYAAHGAGLFPQAAGLIIESGIADPLERTLVRCEPWQLGTDLEGLKAAVEQDLSQHKKLAAFTGRTLIMHTRNDDILELRHAEQLYQWANEPKKLLVFERGDHNNIMQVNETAYFAAIESMLNSL